MTEDPTRAENMHLRAQLTTLQRRHDALARERDELSGVHARTAARLDEVLGSSTWRIALHLVRAAELIPAPLRSAVRSGLRRLRGTGEVTGVAPQAALEAPAPLAGLPAPPTIPSFAQSYGEFLQDDASLAATPWYDVETPEVSVIILNWNRSRMTLACVRYVLRHTAGFRFEIIVADNGSKPDELAILQQSGLPMQVLALGSNLFFGEGNNLAAERARGRYLFLLNNDAFVHDGWLAPLVDALETVPRAAAAGSQLRYPDGTLQEAGSLISPDGVANQIGKNENPTDERFGSLRPVDYVSAAAMLIRRADFLDVLGFDLCYEPAYYEDVDLCMKLRARGDAVIYCPDSVVTHVENATSLDGRLPLRLENAIQANRVTFVARWGEFLLGHPAPAFPALAAYCPAPSGRPRVALHSPFMLTPGGGERYLLSVGAALAGVADVTLVGAVPCSAIRLRRLGLDLGVDVSRIALATLDESAPAADPAFDPAFDLAFVMGNTVLPPVAGLGRRNVYICQFPFPLLPGQGQGWDRHWAGYQRILVYSGFARRHAEQRHEASGLPALPVVTISPPVQMRHRGAKTRQILSVGRFFTGQHCKRQDVMVEAFRELVADGTSVELHLAGSLRPEPQHRDYYLAVVEAAKGLPITIHPNVGPLALDALYAGSMIYWHLTGLGSDPLREPELSEHFGISIIEAMSAGCVPVVFGQGGPLETVTDGQDGFLIDGMPALIARTRELLANDALREAMADRAVESAAGYDEAVFARSLRELAADLLA